MAKLDPAPLLSPMDTNGIRLTDIWQQWLSALSEYVSRLPDFNDPQIIFPLTGFSVQIPDATKVVTIDVPGALANGNLILPANPYDGQPVTITSTSDITSFSLTDGTNTIKNPPTSLSAGVAVSYYYNFANKTWYRT